MVMVVSNLFTISVLAQNDTVQAYQVNVLPQIDGVGDDMCWNESGVEWQAIDQVWMPWKGNVPSSDDFTGKYKVVWNKSENLLYFLVSIIDDKFIDGYNFATNGPSGYPNYDVVEIFIDEDRSKGTHVFDNGSENAQNALSYHLSVNAPADGETTNEFTVEDLDGVNWGNSWVVNYADHFPDFSMKKEGNNYVYEFSLKVYNDTYPTQKKDGSTDTNKELARVTLVEGKIIGMSMAYCDNDLNDGKRDHFFGSTQGKEYSANFGFMGNGYSITSENGQDIFNTCWMSANDYGVLELKSISTATNSEIVVNTNTFSLFPSNVDAAFQIEFRTTELGKVNIELFELNGVKVADFEDQKSSYSYTKNCNIEFLHPGMYITRVILNNEYFVQKIIKQ